ncbi:hypothetical protein ACFSNO_27835 [Streptomyces cirratus]
MHPVRDRGAAASHGVEINGAHVVVLGRGVAPSGAPSGCPDPQVRENATVTLCHTGTRDLPRLLRQADHHSRSAGVPHLVKPEDVKPGARVLDGRRQPRRETGRSSATCTRASRRWRAGCRPNPGGVGPMTRPSCSSMSSRAAERTTSAGLST